MGWGRGVADGMEVGMVDGFDVDVVDDCYIW